MDVWCRVVKATVGRRDRKYLTSGNIDLLERVVPRSITRKWEGTVVASSPDLLKSTSSVGIPRSESPLASLRVILSAPPPMRLASTNETVRGRAVGGALIARDNNKVFEPRQFKLIAII